MEVYFKNLTSEGVSVEKLAEDLMCLADDVEDLVKAAAGDLDEQSQLELATAVQRIKTRCASLRENALAGAQATDRLVRRHPYATTAVALGVGLLVGALAAASWRNSSGD